MTETPYQWVQRSNREADARMAKHMAAIERHRLAGTLAPNTGSKIACGVGTFDCNGVGKGFGW